MVARGVTELQQETVKNPSSSNGREDWPSRRRTEVLAKPKAVEGIAFDRRREERPVKIRLGRFAVAVLAFVIAGPPASGSVTVVRVSSPSPFPIGDCRPDDALLWDDGPGSETDPSVAINPTNPANIVAAWPSDTGYGIVAASSFDGGQTWTRTPVPGLTACTGGVENHILHARLSFGGDGRLYLSGEALDGFFPDPRSFIVRIPVVTSTDGGRTWSRPSRVNELPAFGGFERLAAEPDVPGAAVVVWHSPETVATSFLSRTTDGGRTWIKHKLPNPAPEFQPLQSVLAHPDGTLYVFYYDRTLIGLVAGAAGIAPLGSNLYVARSDDKGVSWSVPYLIARGTLAEWIGTAAGPGGVVYASAWRDRPEGRQLVLMRSSDRGVTWSPPHVIAPAVLAPFPDIASDPQGTIGVTYMVSAGSKTKAVFARSTDGGVSWTRERVAGPFPSGAFGLYQETAGGTDGFASVFIHAGPGTDGPTDVFVARIT